MLPKIPHDAQSNHPWSLKNSKGDSTFSWGSSPGSSGASSPPPSTTTASLISIGYSVACVEPEDVDPPDCWGALYESTIIFKNPLEFPVCWTKAAV